jgi:ribonuclease M5
MRPKVIVVEGIHDIDRVQKVFHDVPVLSIGGSAIVKTQLTIIKKLDETHDIILALDPDHAGERIRKIISKEIKHVYHVFLNPQKAISKKGKKIGLEHMDNKDITDAFKDIKVERREMHSDIDSIFLHDVKLIGHKHSKTYRTELSNRLSLGIVNGKTLLKRLHMFGYTKRDIIEVMNESSS